MDVLITGDRQIQNPNDTPLQISPFPAIGQFIISNPTTTTSEGEVGSTDVVNLPPQKLRPVRGTCRAPSISAFNDLPRLPLAMTEDGQENLGVLVTEEATEVAVTSGGGVGSVSRGGLFEDELRSSSDENTDDSSAAGVEASVSQKRMRKTRKKLDKFLEILVMKVMEKQEQMHKQLVDMIECRERERIIREEAWKQQEIERIKRDNEARAQENSRNLALISFIQNVIGHVIEVPQPFATISPVENNGGNACIQNDVQCDQRNRRWPEAEVQALVMLRTALEQQLQVTGSKGSRIWDTISAGMHNMGYNRTANKCKEKWENLNKHFKKSVRNGAERPFENSRVTPYFNELDVLYDTGCVNLGNGYSHPQNQSPCRME